MLTTGGLIKRLQCWDKIWLLTFGQSTSQSFDMVAGTTLVISLISCIRHVQYMFCPSVGIRLLIGCVLQLLNS